MSTQEGSPKNCQLYPLCPIKDKCFNLIHLKQQASSGTDPATVEHFIAKAAGMTLGPEDPRGRDDPCGMSEEQIKAAGKEALELYYPGYIPNDPDLRPGGH